MSSDSDEDGAPAAMNFGMLQEQLWEILKSKNGQPSNLPSVFLEDEMFEEPFSLEEIKSDPKKHILWAAEHNELQLVNTLLDSDPKLIDSTDEDGYTALHRASYNGHLDMISLLVKRGANVHSCTVDGWQPFHSACRWNNVEAAKLLKSLGCDVNALTNGNNTALHLAASNGDAGETIKYLLHETSVDTSVVNSGSDTAQSIAERNSNFAKYFSKPLEKMEEHEAEDLEVCNVVIVPGNGAGDVYHANWYSWAHKKLNTDSRISCRLENMPDPVTARQSIWLPFMEKELGCDRNTIIVGHSSGAVAALRYAETHQVFALVLVAAYISDLGEESEQQSGYFNRPWLWEDIKSNCKHILQFGSRDDPFLPWHEQEIVAKSTDAQLFASDDSGHYMNSTLPQLVKVVTQLVDKKCS